MRKVLSYILMFLLIGFIASINVFAKEELFNCKYTVDSLKSIIPSATAENFSFTYHVYDDGTILSASFDDYNGTDKFGNYYLTGLASFNKNYYKQATEGGNHCPTIKFATDGVSNLSLLFESQVTDALNTKTVTPVLTNVTKKEENQANTETIICTRSSTLRVGQVSSETITIDFYKEGTTKKFRVKSSLGDSASGLASSYITVTGKTYSLGTGYTKYYESESACKNAPLYLNAENGDSSVKITTEKPEDVNNGAKPVTEADTDTGHNDPVDKEEVTDATGTCPIGKDVAQDLKGAWNIVKIVVPLLAIALTIIDAIRTIAKGDASSELKKVALTFVKRIIYVVILFFLNALLTVLFDILLPEKYCSLDNMLSGNGVEGTEVNPGGGSGGGSGSSQNYTQIKQCEDVKTQAECPSSCKWGYNNSSTLHCYYEASSSSQNYTQIKQCEDAKTQAECPSSCKWGYNNSSTLHCYYETSSSNQNSSQIKQCSDAKTSSECISMKSKGCDWGYNNSSQLHCYYKG